MTTGTKYNGWTNYETWCVNLWIGNEEPSYLHWREVATEIWDARDEHPDYWTESEYARFTLADALQEWAEESAPDLGASMWTDLLTAALSEVRWSEIANSMLAETDGYEAPTADYTAQP